MRRLRRSIGPLGAVVVGAFPAAAAGQGGGDLQLTLGAPAHVATGQDIVYTIGVRNRGPGTAEGVSVTDTPPEGLTVESTSGQCDAGPPVTCAIGMLPARGFASIRVVVRAGAPALVEDAAIVRQTTSDPNPVNDSAQVVSEVQPAAPPFAGVLVRKVGRTLGRGGRLAVVAACDASVLGPCSGRLTLQTAHAVDVGQGQSAVATLASTPFNLAPARSARLTLALTAFGRRLIHDRHALPVVVESDAQDGSGALASNRMPLTLRAAASPRRAHRARQP